MPSFPFQREAPLKKVIVSAVLLTLVGGGTYWYISSAPAKTNPAVAWGNVDTRQVSLAFEGSGRILTLNKEEGERVTKGEALGELDTEALSIALREAEANTRALTAAVSLAEEGYRREDIEAARAQAASLEKQTELARITWARQVELKKANTTTAQALDEARLKLESLRRELDAANQNLRKLEAGLRPQEVAEVRARADAGRAAVDSLHYQIEKAARLVSPVSGVIRSRLAEPGDMASASRTIYQIAVTDPKWVRAYVTETQLGFVKEGAEATILTDTTEPVAATVGYISSTAEFTPKTVQTQDLRTVLVYEVRLNVRDPDNRLRLGQPVTVDFSGAPSGRAP